jgi:DnaJ-class molecular chaperone
VCDGKGQTPREGGRYTARCDECHGSGIRNWQKVMCPACSGSGYDQGTCQTCFGAGILLPEK